MRVLHATLLGGSSPGVVNQMVWEQQAAHDMHIDWDARIYCPESLEAGNVWVSGAAALCKPGTGLFKKVEYWFRLRSSYYKWLARTIGGYDTVLLRYCPYDPFQLCFLIKNRKRHIYLVHHTLELKELALSSGRLKAFAKVLAERVLGALSLRYCFGLIGVTEEILIHEQSRCGGKVARGSVYPNGVLYSPNLKTLDLRSKSDTPSFLFVASYFSSWHGLDLLLQSIEGTNEQFVLHLVGELSPSQMKKALNDSRVVVHGRMTNAGIAELSRRCWVGLGSFALSQKGMRQACTLKVREYLVNGLPVYAGHTDVFAKSFPYFRCGDPTIRLLLAYAAEVRESDPQDVSASAEPYISKSKLLAKLYAWLGTG